VAEDLTSQIFLKVVRGLNALIAKSPEHSPVYANFVPRAWMATIWDS